MEVPHGRVAPDVLRRVAEEFVTRDGTDYGAAVLKAAPGIVRLMAEAIETEANMGDRSPKSKHRDQKQKDTAKASDAAAAKSKQDAQSRAPLPNLKRQK